MINVGNSSVVVDVAVLKRQQTMVTVSVASGMGITVVHAAHRQQVIDDADVVITIGDMDVVATESGQITA